MLRYKTIAVSPPRLGNSRTPAQEAVFGPPVSYPHQIDTYARNQTDKAKIKGIAMGEPVRCPRCTRRNSRKMYEINMVPCYRCLHCGNVFQVLVYGSLR